MATTAAEFNGQLAQLSAQLQQALDRLLSMQNVLEATQRSNRDLHDRLAVAEQNLAAGAGGAGRSSYEDIKGGLFDKKLFEPHTLEDAKDFRDWAEEFEDWVAMCDKDIPELLKTSAREKVQITALGSTQFIVDKAKPLYRMMKNHHHPSGWQEPI